MTMTTKMIWIAATMLNSIALLYFWIGSTAFFNRAPGTDWGYYFIIIGIPIAILIIISIVYIASGWIPRNTSTQIMLIAVIVCVTLFAMYTAPLPIEKEGWLTEMVDAPWFVQTTDDGKYEYFLEIINAGQRNSSARLFVRNIATGEETRIPLDMKNERIGIRTWSFNEESAWSYLVASETSQLIYYLTTTENLNRQIESFKIDMETKTSRRIELMQP